MGSTPKNCPRHEAQAKRAAEVPPTPAPVGAPPNVNPLATRATEPKLQPQKTQDMLKTSVRGRYSISR